MNIIVSNNNKRYSGWTVVSTLKDVIGIVGEVPFLVYHKSADNAEESVRQLTLIMNEHPETTVLYVRSRDEMIQAIRILVEGSGGKYIDDEFFLEDEAQLGMLTDQWKNMVALTEMSGVNILSDFINRYMKSGSKGISPGYLSIVKQAASDMAKAYQDKSLEMLKLCESASDLFRGSVTLVENMQEEQSRLEGVVQELRNKLQDSSILAVKQAPVECVPSIGYFPRVSYMKTRTSIIRVKDIGRCQYLLSFMLGFRSYLQQVKSVRPRLVVIEPLGDMLSTIYSDYPWVTQKSKSSMQSYNGDVVFTNCPLKDVIDRLLSNSSYDTVIVLDRLTTSHQHILNCAGEEVLYCVKGISAIEKFKLNKKKCFTSLAEVGGTMFTIPMFMEYPKESDLRNRKYLSECGTYYELMHSVKLY